MRLPSPLLAALLPLVTGVAAGDEPAPPAIRAVQECRVLEDAAARLACYDAAVDALTAEVESGETIAVSRAEVEAARRESIGLEHARLPGGLSEAPPPPPSALTLRVVSFGETADGRLTFVTDTGQRWSQVEAKRIRLLPEPPLDAELRPGMGNTFFVSLGGRDAGRMRRDR